MAETHVLSALIAKRAELAGKIEHLQDQLRSIVIDLVNVDHTIHIFDPTIELAEIHKRPVPPRHQAFKGEVTRIVLETLRNAKRPLTSAEIGQRVMAERGLDTGQENGAIEALGQVVAGAVLEGADLVTRALPGSGEDHDRVGCPLGAIADQVEDLDRVHVRQLEVEDGQVGQVLASKPDPIGSVMGDQYLIAGALEDAHRHRRQLPVVFDH